jgi:hypothetical protein
MPRAILIRVLCLALLGGVLALQAGIALHHHEDGELHEDCPLYGLMIGFAWEGLGDAPEVPSPEDSAEERWTAIDGTLLRFSFDRPASRAPPQLS